MNKKIIDQFIKLSSYIDFLIKDFKIKNMKKEETVYSFKQKQIKRVIDFLKKYPEKITKKNYINLLDIDGIGKGTVDRIKEILDTNKLEELKDFKITHRKLDIKNKIINELSQVINMGPIKAKELYDMGVKSIDDLKNKIDLGKIKVNDKIKLGLKYHGIIKTNIPRSEINDIFELLKKIINIMNIPYIDSCQYIIEICGSYRREKLFSNDIDVLITKKGQLNNENHLKLFINKLKENIKENNNKPLLIDDMTDKIIKTKYMGFLKYMNFPVRRIDIRFIPYESYYYALLYFTGSKELNKKMRQIAKNKGYTLSEYNLLDKDGNKYKVKSEKDIFKKLDLEYIPPKLR